MTKKELHTLESEKLVEWLINLCFHAAHGSARAEKQIRIPEEEILRRLEILQTLENEGKA